MFLMAIFALGTSNVSVVAETTGAALAASALSLTAANDGPLAWAGSTMSGLAALFGQQGWFGVFQLA